MSQPEIQAEKINSPIQLMAAWFVMLILLSGVLLAAAAKIEKPQWAAGYLVICTTLLILMVVVAVFLMLTKFRPHLQEGKEYAEWLKDKNTYSPGLIKESGSDKRQELIQKKFEKLKSSILDTNKVDIINQLEDSMLYTINVSDVEGADEIVEAMKELNIDASIYQGSSNSSRKLSDQKAIWLGKNIPASVAIPIIKKAVSIWPHLEYIAFPSESAPEDTLWQIYLGGATSTAMARGYEKWSLEEINNLPDRSKTREFHAKVRAKYP